MLTLFACPKPFVDQHIRTIQLNAIRSWLCLNPRPHIVLFGNETGTAEICEELSLAHVPEVRVNEFGTPLLNDIFRKIEQTSEHDLLCYINADIMLMSDFVSALKLVATQKRRFLMGARPWNLNVHQELSFIDGWEQAIGDRVGSEGQLRSERSCDFFVFPRGLWGELPPFAIGRAYFDNALLYRARRVGAALIDATPAVVAVHQNHGYANHIDGPNMLGNVEARRNVQLAGGPGRKLTWKSSTHVVIDGRVRFNAPGVLRFFGPWSRPSKMLRCVLGFPAYMKQLILGRARA
jgi:hypothetical protein